MFVCLKGVNATDHDVFPFDLETYVLFQKTIGLVYCFQINQQD